METDDYTGVWKDRFVLLTETSETQDETHQEQEGIQVELKAAS